MKMNIGGNATMKKIKKKLPCEITDAEHRALSDELVGWLSDIDERKQEIKDVKLKHRDQIENAEKQAEDLRLTLKTGTVPRDVDCARIFNWETMMTHVRRIDSGAIVPGTVREMTPEERQADHTQKPCPGKFLLTGNSESGVSAASPDKSNLPPPRKEVDITDYDVVDDDDDEYKDSEVQELVFDDEATNPEKDITPPHTDEDNFLD